MSVIGLDVGNANCVVGMVRQQGIAPDVQYLIDIALNEESNQETPALVSFTNKQRLFGSMATFYQLKDPRKTISQVKRLIGRKFKDSEVQKDIKRLPYKVSENKCDGPDKGSLLIHVKCFHNGKLEKKELTPTQMMAMTLSNLKSIAEKNTGGSIENCVIAIPVYFTHAQRQAYLDAASIAGLRPLCLMHETAATALAYGIYHRELPMKDPRYVVFIDIGHSSMQVCVVGFKRGQGKVLGHGFDCSLGGRDFDAVLFEHFANEFKKKYKIDVTSNRKASQRLWTACEKLKRVLSANPEATFNIECLMEEKDVSGFMTRKYFEKLASSLLDRVKGPCDRALDMAKLSVGDIHSVELVGSCFRIPAIFNILSTHFQKELGRTMNASVCVARGCTLQCAIFTPSFQVRDFKLHDSFPCPIKVSWKGQGTVVDRTAGDNQSGEHTIFKAGDIFPNMKILHFFRSNQFDIFVSYMDGMDSPREFTISPSKSMKVQNPKIKVKICLDRHGMISISSTFPEDGGVPVNNAARNSDSMDNVRGSTRLKNRSIVPVDKPRKMEEEQANFGNLFPRITGMKTGSKWNDVPEKGVLVKASAEAELKKAQKLENDMQQQDRDMMETKRCKNDLEAYVYGTRLKLNEKDKKYGNDSKIEELLKEFEKMESWLYGEGKDVEKAEYKGNLSRLNKLWDSIEERFKEKCTLNEGTPGADQSTQCMQSLIASDSKHKEQCLIEKHQAISMDRFKTSEIDRTVKSGSIASKTKGNVEFGSTGSHMKGNAKFGSTASQMKGNSESGSTGSHIKGYAESGSISCQAKGSAESVSIPSQSKENAESKSIPSQRKGKAKFGSTCSQTKGNAESESTPSQTKENAEYRSICSQRKGNTESGSTCPQMKINAKYGSTSSHTKLNTKHDLTSSQMNRNAKSGSTPSQMNRNAKSGSTPSQMKKITESGSTPSEIKIYGESGSNPSQKKTKTESTSTPSQMNRNAESGPTGTHMKGNDESRSTSSQRKGNAESGSTSPKTKINAKYGSTSSHTKLITKHGLTSSQMNRNAKSGSTHSQMKRNTESGSTPSEIKINGESGSTPLQKKRNSESASTPSQMNRNAESGSTPSQMRINAESGSTGTHMKGNDESGSTSSQRKGNAESGSTPSQMEINAESGSTNTHMKQNNESGSTFSQRKGNAKSRSTPSQKKGNAEIGSTCSQTKRNAESGSTPSQKKGNAQSRSTPSQRRGNTESGSTSSQTKGIAESALTPSQRKGNAKVVSCSSKTKGNAESNSTSSQIKRNAKSGSGASQRKKNVANLFTKKKC